MYDKDDSHTLKGMVMMKTIGQYHVMWKDSIVSCTFTPRYQRQAKGKDKRRSGSHPGYDDNSPALEPAVGDRVEVDIRDGNGRITAVLPRSSQLSRRSAVPMPTARAHEQVIAANVDLVVPVIAAAEPPPKWNLLDRYLTSAEANDLPAVVCLTKVDLVTDAAGGLDETIQQAAELYRHIGYQAILVSAVSGEGIAELAAALKGSLSVLVGKSGVGKTSLLNALQPGLGGRVTQVSRLTGKGRHTTTGLQIFQLDFGGALIDTPGTREFGLWDLPPDELADYFIEMREYHVKCRFGLGCRHRDEPGCAVRQAVMEEKISPQRYASYLKLLEDI